MNIVNETQISFGKRLDLDLTEKSVGVANAMIQDAIDLIFHGRNDLGTPSDKQVQLAKKYGQDISSSTRRVGDAVIDQIMLQLNKEAISREGLLPGASVVNINDPQQNVRVISSIKDNGTVYFRGGNGAKAWARNLKIVSVSLQDMKPGDR